MNWEFIFNFLLLVHMIGRTPTTHANAVNTIDMLEMRFSLILVQLCASEIDSNKMNSAMMKFDQLSNANQSITDIVQFYLDNYKENFDNLLEFIDAVPTLELQQLGYNVVINDCGCAKF